MQSAPIEKKKPTPARFESESASLILYAGGKKVAVFSLGAYETDDPKVIAVLRGSADVREVVEGASDDRS